MRSLAVIAAISLVAAASCGGDDDDDTDASAPTGTEAITDGTEAGADTTTATEETDATEPADDRRGDSTEPPTTDAETAPSMPEGPGEHHLTESEGEPVQGGTLVYGLEADTANAWAPYRASYATSGYVPLGAVTDSLFTNDENGEIVAEPRRVVARTTTTTRSGRCTSVRASRFHDGTPLDAAAVKFNIDACRASPLTARRLHADRQRRGRPARTSTSRRQGGRGSRCRSYFTGGSCGYMLSPQWLGSLADVPQRQRGQPGLRRRARRDAGRRRPGRPGRSRCVRVRVLHAGQRQLVHGRAQRGLLAWPQRHHR